MLFCVLSGPSSQPHGCSGSAGLLTRLQQSLGTDLMEGACAGRGQSWAEPLQLRSSYSSPGEGATLRDSCVRQREFPGKAPWQIAPVRLLSTAAELPCCKGKYRGFKPPSQGREAACSWWRAELSGMEKQRWSSQALRILLHVTDKQQYIWTT